MNPFPGQVDGRLFGLLEAWFFWVGREGTAQSQAGHLEFIGDLGIRPDGSYKEHEPHRMTGFQVCFDSLGDEDQIAVAALIKYENEAFPGGENWLKTLRRLRLVSGRKPNDRALDRAGRRYLNLVARALTRLERAAREAGWL